MQGRLCEPVNGKIQAFPWRDWEREFLYASAIDLHLMEWTLDQDRLYDNPLMTSSGQRKIRQLSQRYDVAIPSLTADCFMQAPFWKAFGSESTALKSDFLAIARACAAVGTKILVVPLVDNGRIDNALQEDTIVEFLYLHTDFFRAHGLRLAFESDFPPAELVRLLNRLPCDTFGVNYDTGNSAALGYKPEEEFSAYGPRIFNVHIKDRILGGTTVPLGTGDADFLTVFRLLRAIAYSGNLIMQTARASDNNHAGVLCQYIKQIEGWSRVF